MRAKFWNFPKRENSTKLPPADAPWHPEINLKAGTSFVNPSLLLGSPDSETNINSYNYCQLSTGEYYFINEWISVRANLWEAVCSMDLLATYRSQILSTTAFVEYDTTGNSELIDYRLSRVTTATRAENHAPFDPPYLSTGDYVLTASGRDGSVTSYIVPFEKLPTILSTVSQWADNIFDDVDSDWRAIVNLGKQLISVGSAAENIRSCTWLPWNLDGILGAKKNIWLGNYDTGVSATVPYVFTRANFVDMSIPWQFTDWRNASLNTSVSVYLPYVGIAALDASTLKYIDTIRIRYGIDLRTGNIAYVLTNPEQTEFYGSYGGCAGGSVPIGVSNVSPSSIVNGISSAVTSLVSGNAMDAVGSLGQIAENIINPQVTTVGGLSSAAGAAVILDYFSIFTNCHDTNVAPSSVSSVMGTPTMATKSLSGLTGFVKCRGASVAANAGKTELSSINAMLNNGIYIE